MKCIKCGLNDRTYVVKTGKRKGKIQSYCKQCNKENVIVRQKQFKQKCVDYCGGKCCKCGYNKYIGALDFHHIDPSEKDFELSHLARTSWDKNKEIVTKELEKCILVCSNCHREIHAGLL